MDKLGVHKVYEFDGFRLDALHLMLYHGNDEIAVPPKAVETLLALIERRGQIVAKDELMKIIWSDAVVEESNLALYLHILRKTLGSRTDGKPFIETLRRRGYRFNGDVRLSEASNGGADPARHQVEGSLLIHPRPLNVERRGNVLALADWKEGSPTAGSPTAVEQQDETASSVAGPKRSFRAAVIAGVACVLVILTALFAARSGYIPVRGTAETKGELAITILTSGEEVGAATISPDGNYFVYATHDGKFSHLWIQQPEQANRIEITEPITGMITGTTFTRDSKQVYFATREGDNETLYRAPILGGVRTRVLNDVAYSVSFSPDGREIVFRRIKRDTNQSWLMIASADGSNERVLRSFDTPTAQAINSPVWSPDGKLIAYGQANLTSTVEGICTIAGINPQTSETSSLSPERWDNCFRMAWTSDGEGLVFVGTKAKEALSTRRDQIYYLPIATGESRRISTDGSRYQTDVLGVTDTDEILASPYNRMSQIWSMSADGDSRTAVQLTKGFADGRGGIAPLIDGRIAYLTRNGDGFSIWVMNADGSNRKQVTTDPPAIEELRAAPDGSFFVFSAKRDGQTHLFRVDRDGGDLKQLTFGDGFEVDSSISRDGTQIAYQSQTLVAGVSKTSMLRVAADGGPPVRLGDRNCATPHYSPDSRLLSCVSEDWKTIYVISPDNGEVVRSFRAADGSQLNVGAPWTPDGGSLAYIVFQNDTGNIHIQPINGSSTRALTDFTSGDIYNFAFSHDGARLYLARGYALRNTVLIRHFR